jgi:hypothetical protein
MRSVPAARLDLGAAGYGYGWRPHRNVQLSDAQARALVRQNHGLVSSKHAPAHGHRFKGWWKYRTK